MPIPGTRKVHRLEENATAAGPELRDGVLQELDTLAERVWGRYADLTLTSAGPRAEGG